MKIQFIPKDNGPDRLVCEAEIVFEDESLKGLKLVGFSLWKSPEGEVYVTFPSRAFGAGSDRRYYDFLRCRRGGRGRRETPQDPDPRGLPLAVARGDAVLVPAPWPGRLARLGLVFFGGPR